MTEWWTGLAPAELALECGPHQHTLRWDAGRLLAPDHPDADRERALIALGADPAPCLEVVGEWQEHAEDLDVLVLASRGANDELRPGPRAWWGKMPLPPRFAAHQAVHSYPVPTRAAIQVAGWTSYSPLHDHGSFDPLDRLLRLGGGLADRFVATVIATWAERVGSSDPRVPSASAQLRAALYGRFVSTVHIWTAGSTSVELTMIPPHVPPTLSRGDGTIRVELPFTWLRDVWGRGLATIFGRLCLAVEQIGADEWRLLTVGPDFAPPRESTLSLG